MAFDVFAAFPTGTVEFPEPAFQFVDALVQGITCLSERQYIALAVVGSRNIFAGVRVWFLRRRFMKRGTFNELFDCYQKILLMIPLEDIASVAAVMEGLSATISKDHE